jgi:tetratricopeptide (TPR) repeat protein
VQSLKWLPFVVAVSVVLIPTPVSAQATKPTFAMQIQVQVRLQDGSAAPPGALCELDYQNGEPLEQEQTDSGGKCRFVPPAHAVYVIRIRASGYLQATQRVDLQNSQTGMAFLVLRPDPSQAPPEPHESARGASVSAFDLSAPEPARKEYDQGQRAIEKHDLAGGIAHLKKAIEMHEQFPQAYTMLGTAFNEQKKWKDAQGALEKAVQQDPKAVEAYFQLGACLSRQADYGGAVKALNKGLELNPDAAHTPAAHYELAKSYLALGQWQDANPHAAKAVAMEPDVASWHILMGNINLKKGDGQGAISEFQAYLKLDPNGSAAASIRDMIPKIQAAMQKKVAARSHIAYSIPTTSSTMDQLERERSAKASRSAVAAAPSGEAQAASIASRFSQCSSTTASHAGGLRLESCAA